MRILYFFQELSTPMFQWQRRHFIEELSHHNITIETFNPLLFCSPEEANEKLIKRVKSGRYDLFLSNMGYYKMLHIDTLEAIKKLGIPTMRIAWDNLMIPYIDKQLSPHFDLVWLTAKETSNLYKKWGVNYFFAPYAANPYTYIYKFKEMSRGVCFIGTPHGSRAIMINELTKNGIIVDLYHGNRVNSSIENQLIDIKFNTINPSSIETILNRFRFNEGHKLLAGSVLNKIKGQSSIIYNDYLHEYPGLSDEELIQTYSNSVLALASSSAGHTDVLLNPLKIVNLRNFEIPMCGGIELCKYSDELAGYFEDGKEIILYHNNEDLVEKAKYFTNKATDTEILKIKQAARKRAENDHTWFSRFKTAFEVLGLKN